MRASLYTSQEPTLSKILKTPTTPFYSIIFFVEGLLWKGYHVRPRGVFSLGHFWYWNVGGGTGGQCHSNPPPPKKKKTQKTKTKRTQYSQLHWLCGAEIKWQEETSPPQRNYDDRQKMEQAFWTETRESTAILRTSKASSVSPIHRALVAQLVEQGAVMREVAGS